MRTRPLWRLSAALLCLPMLLCLAGCPDPGPEPEADAGPARLVDPLSMPAKPTVDLAAFKTSADCADCHAEHVRQWRLSRHAFAMKDPVFRRLVALRNEAKTHTEDRFCTQCHSTVGSRSGAIGPGFDFDSLPPVVQEGVTCEVCHKSTEVVRTHNAGHRVDGKVGLGATLQDPVVNSFHESRNAPHLASAGFCGSCHDVVETSGLPLERPHAEWQTSPAQGKGQTCQDCHMPGSKRPAAAGGPERQVHSHLFVGVERPVGGGVQLSDADKAELDGAIETLLGSAASLALEATRSQPAAGEGGQIDAVITVTNQIAGHNFPTGSTFLRQVWIGLEARDASGKLLYVTGDLDANGDLRDHWSELDPYGDSDLISLSSRFVDLNGNRTLFTWEAVEHTSDAIEPLKSRTWTLFVPVPKGTQGPVTIQATLHFRAYGPFLLRLLGLKELIPGFPIWDIAKAKASVPVSP